MQEAAFDAFGALYETFGIRDADWDRITDRLATMTACEQRDAYMHSVLCEHFLERGCHIILAGLQARPELNGRLAVIAGSCCEARLPVDLVDEDGDSRDQPRVQLRVRSCNMRPAEAPATGESSEGPSKEPSGDQLPWSVARAAEAADEAAVIAYLDGGGHVDARTVEASGSLTMLMLASRQGHVRMVVLLLARGADPNLRHMVGGTALMAAADQGHLAVAKHLLRGGARRELVDEDGWSALDFAREGDELESRAIVDLLHG